MVVLLLWGHVELHADYPHKTFITSDETQLSLLRHSVPDLIWLQLSILVKLISVIIFAMTPANIAFKFCTDNSCVKNLFDLEKKVRALAACTFHC